MIKPLSVRRSRTKPKLFTVVIRDEHMDVLRKIVKDRRALFPPYATIFSPNISNGDGTSVYYLYDYELAILFPATLRRIS